MEDRETDPMAAVAAKRDHVLERLNKRNKDRQNYLDVKLEQRTKESLQLEGADYFSQAFAERAREIETHLQIINESAITNHGSGGDAPNTDLARFFAGITNDIQELERYLTTSTMFLTDYKIKACQAVLHELASACEETRARLMPKKKFGFSGRKVAPKVVINPKISSTNDVKAGDKVDTSEKTKLAGDKAFSWTLSNKHNAYICLTGQQVNDQDITMANLNNCFVELQGHAGSVQLSNVQNSFILCGPVARSLFAENCQQTSFVVACQQLRLHSSKACTLYLHVTCRAIIEDCKSIEVQDYSYFYEHIDEDFRKAGLDKRQNNYKDVADFNWLSPDVPSPNWRLASSEGGDLSKAPNWTELRLKFKALQDSGNHNARNEAAASAPLI